MACLYDVNVWVALAFGSHPHHRIASEHFRACDSARPATFCRVTQQGFLRLVSSPLLQQTYGSAAITNADAWSKCEALMNLPQVAWFDEPQSLPALWQSMASLASPSPKVWTDAYLAAFAIGHRFELVTLDGDFKAYTKDGLQLQLLGQ